MHVAVSALQVIVALGLLNVWVLRSSRNTPYRGGDAKTLKEEFAAYGFPAWFCYLVGALKIGAAFALLAAIWLQSLLLPAAALVAVLMAGAVAMHLRVRDPLVKSAPALAMLLLCTAMCALA